jgi:protein O-GlcNAc transferase
MIKFLRDPYYKLIASIGYLLRFNSTKKHQLPNKLIISLTSYPPRFSALHLTIKTLMAQTIQPDYILLWVYEPEFELLPDKVKKLQNDVFQIKTVNKNLRSFTKLIPSFKLFPDAFIATADDDTYYPKDWLETLTTNIQYKDKIIIGHRAHLMRTYQDKSIQPYQDWDTNTNSLVAGKDIFLLTGPGILFYPNCLPAVAFDDEVFLKICATQDDVWFYFMLRLNGYQFKQVGRKSKLITWKGSQKVGLYHVNVYENMNDIYIQNMIKEFGNPLAF